MHHPRWFLFLTAFITGAVVMALEILGSRLLAPVFGSSLFVWGALIGVILAAMSSGYAFGGWISDRRPGGQVLGPGAGDNAAAALALDLAPGDVAVSIGTSGVVSAVSSTPTADASGLVTGFAGAGDERTGTRAGPSATGGSTVG